MSLRSKIFLLLGLIFGLYALVDNYVQRVLVLPTFKSLEDQNAEEDIQRCAEALRREKISLRDSLHAWAMSADSEQFLRDHDPVAIERAMGEGKLDESRINFVLFVDPSGTVIWSRRIELTDNSASSTAEGAPHARRQVDQLTEFATGASLQGSPLLEFGRGESFSDVILSDAGNPMIVAARKDPHGFGTVVMGRLIDDSMHGELQRQAGIQFEILPAAGLSPGDRQGLNAAAASKTTHIETKDENLLRVYTVVRDRAEQPVLLLASNVPRTISQRGSAAVNYAQASLLFLSVFVIVIMGLLMEKLVLSRVGSLSRFCRAVEKLPTPGSRITVEGSDELARLGKDINRMLAELENSRRQLDEALAESRQATQAKSEFLAVMSHEIRTPMNGVLGMLGVLANTQLSADQYDHLSVAQESAENLLRLLNDILDFSKIEAGKLEIEEIEFNLPMLIEDNLRACSLKAREKGLELITDINPEIPELLVGDPGRIRQILGNLINNAIKFTHEGYVAVVAGLEQQDDDSSLVKISIHDSGIGIPEDRLERLFKSFSQVDASTTRKYGGSGLGLAICSTLAEMMGGQCGVESEEGRGSTFWFTLRLHRVAEIRKPRPLPLSELRGHSVLLVDDSMINRRVMNLQLSKWGLLVAEADSGRQALEMLRTAAHAGQPYEVVILDYIMPGLNGQELGQTILSDPLIGNTRLILVTSAGQRGDATKFHSLGYSAYLSKPITQNQLVECVASVLGLEEVPHSAPQRPPLVTKYTLAEGQASSLEVLLAEDNRVNQKVALALLGRAGHKVDVVENGRAAIDALKSREYDIVFMDVHMPELDGFAATQAIRRMGNRMALVPIIAMTARAMESDRQVCLDSGMDDYLSKPINPVELFAAIERARSLRDERLAIWEESTLPQQASERAGLTVLDSLASDAAQHLASEPAEKIGLEVLAGSNWDGSVLMPDEPMDIGLSVEHVGDRKFWLELVEVFLGEMPGRINGLRKAIEQGDAEQVEHLAHSIKGSCAEMLAEPMRQISFALESCARDDNLAEAPELLDKLIDSYRELEEVLLRERTLVA